MMTWPSGARIVTQKGLNYKCFLVNFVKFFKTDFYRRSQCDCYRPFRTQAPKKTSPIRRNIGPQFFQTRSIAQKYPVKELF